MKVLMLNVAHFILNMLSKLVKNDYSRTQSLKG